jgi:hypothetical protein
MLRPAISPEARMNQLISLATDEAERQIREGIASSQIITQFLKLGSEREQLELEKIRRENALLEAKKQNLEDSQENKKLYSEALQAFRSYSGQNSNDQLVDPTMQDPNNPNKDGT